MAEKPNDHHLTLMGASLATAVEAVVQNAYSKEKKLDCMMLGNMKMANDTSQLASYCKKLLRLAHSVEQFDDILPFLDAVDSGIGIHETLPCAAEWDRDMRALSDELIEQAGREGKLESYFAPHPEVEGWINHYAKKIVEIINPREKLHANKGKLLAHLMIGIIVACYELIAGVSGYFFRKDTSPTHREYSAVVSGMTHIRCALYLTVMRDMIPAFNETPADMATTLRHFQDHHWKPDAAFPMRHKYSYVRGYLEKLKRDHSLLETAIDCADARALFPLFTEHAAHAFGVDKHEPAKTMPTVLPAGLITLVQPLPADMAINIEKQREEPAPSLWSYYTVEGFTHETCLGITLIGAPETGENFEPFLPNGERLDYTVKNIMHCFLDDAGKAYMSRAERYAPPPREKPWQESSQLVHAASAAANGQLLGYWEKHPDLFRHLQHHGPAILLTNNGRVQLFIRSDCKDAVASYEPGTWLSAEESAATLRRLNIETSCPWIGMSLEEPKKDAAKEQAPRKTDDSPTAWRRKIVQKLHGKVPGYDWLKSHLENFGVTETKGKGSHRAFHRNVGGRELAQGSSAEIRNTTEPLSIAYLWDCLDRLEIGFQEFYEQVWGK